MKCVYDANYPEFPCQHCSTDPLKTSQCIKKHAPNNQQTPPPQSSTGVLRMRDYAEQYERLYPSATLDEVLVYLMTRPWDPQQQQQTAQQTVQQTTVAENAPGYVWTGNYGGGYPGNGPYYSQ
jgi:hypothetical protein